MARRKYPWEEWLSNPRTVLRAGVDYHISQYHMAVTIRNNASMRGAKISLKDMRDGFVITVVEGIGYVEQEVSHTDKTTVPV